MARATEDDDGLLPLEDIPLEEVAAQQVMSLGPQWLDRSGKVAEFTVVANRKGTGYTPVNGLSEFAGVDLPGQRKKVQGHGVMKHHLRRFRIQGKGGPQVTLCIELRLGPYFVANLDVERVRPDLRPVLVPLQEAMINFAFDFMLGMAIQAGLQPISPEVLSAEWGQHINGEVMDLRHQMQRLLFALNGLRARMNIVEASQMPPGLPPEQDEGDGEQDEGDQDGAPRKK